MLEATWNTHVYIELGDLLFVLPFSLLKTLSGLPPDPGEPYPEAFVFGSGDAYAKVVHETAAGARTFDLSTAFKALSVCDRSSLILDPACGTGSYLCLSALAAEKLGRRVVDAAVKAKELTSQWIPPIQPVTDGTADGGQDGLLEVNNRHFWIQVTGGRSPGILPNAKWPSKVAEQFFIPEGETLMKGRKLERRMKMFGLRMPAQADLLHLAVGKAPPQALHGAIRGVVWEIAGGRSKERRFVQTITVHCLMSVEPMRLAAPRDPQLTQLANPVDLRCSPSLIAPETHQAINQILAIVRMARSLGFAAGL